MTPELDVRFSPNAERHFWRAQAYFDEHAPHETERFIDATFAAARQLGTHPWIGRVLQSDVRYWHVDGFPVQLWYRVNVDLGVVRVLAVVSDRQDRNGLLADL